MHPAIVPNVSSPRQSFIAPESRARGIMTTLADFIQILWRRRAVVLTTIIASLLIAIAYLIAATPKYAATVSLLIQNKEDTFQQLAMIEEAITGAATPGEDVVTELEVMRSRRLAAKVVDDMDLINDPEFNEALVEQGTVQQVFDRPLHPYTHGLMKSMPALSGDTGRMPCIKGQVPSPLNLPRGCNFADRCPYVKDKCRMEEPDLADVGEGRQAACWFADRWLRNGMPDA